MKKYLLILLLAFLAVSCKNEKEKITLSMWHSYGGSMQKSMDTLIERFNSTEGKKEGIVINVTAISSSAELNKVLSQIASGDPGAPELPDICTAYPRIALPFAQQEKIVDLGTLFTDKELEEYVPEFLEEGRIEKTLYVFPLAKSTEVLYLNNTFYDNFAKEENLPNNQLSTLEGILEAATLYSQKTGKSFFTSDSFYNLFECGLRQKGVPLIKDGRINTEAEEFKELFLQLHEAIQEKGILLYKGYSSDLSKTGDILCSTGSSAGILFYGDTITYPDNRIEQVDYRILPYPVMEGGEKIALQRGGGLIVKKSTKEREKAAGVFLKWLTSKEQNLEFIRSTGYLPVTKSAFTEGLEEQIKVEDPRIAKMLETVMRMRSEYTFYAPEVFDGYEELTKTFQTAFREAMKEENAEVAFSKMVGLL